MVLGITGLRPHRRFSKAYRKLDGQHQDAVNVALDELLNNDDLPVGRKLEKVRSRKDTWAIRVSKGIRLSFELENSTCVLRNVGEHDKILNNP